MNKNDPWYIAGVTIIIVLMLGYPIIVVALK